MTKQQKEIDLLKKQNRKLERDNFILKGKVKELERENRRLEVEASVAEDRRYLYEEKLDDADPGWKQRE
jgi:predicted RNase H-like nuclease (RuvC/YqgF family)